MTTITKMCTGCQLEKPLTAFSNSSSTNDGKMYVCAKCNREINRIWRQTPSGIYTNIKSRCKYYEKHEGANRNAKPFNMKRTDFINWYDSQPKICGYCGVPEEHLHVIEKDFSRNSTRLEIDCKDNDIGYTIDNLILSCRRCNFTKSNYFNYAEMRNIGQNVAKPKWEQEIHTKNVTEVTDSVTKEEKL